MAPPNLTRADAQARAALLQVAEYTVALDLTDGGGLEQGKARPGESTFATDVTVHFACHSARRVELDRLRRRGGALRHVQRRRAGHRELPRGGRDRPARPCRRQRAGRRADAATCTPARACTGSSIRSTGEVYLYTQFETADCARVYACFDQPDLKARFTLHGHRARALAGDLQRPAAGADRAGDGVRRCGASHRHRASPPTSPRWSPGRTRRARRVSDTNGDIPLGVFCRASLAQHLDADGSSR